MVANLIALAVFGASFWLRWIATVGFLPVGFSLVGLVVLGLAGWFGDELVFVHGMGVKPPREASRPRPASSNRRIA